MKPIAGVVLAAGVIAMVGGAIGYRVGLENADTKTPLQQGYVLGYQEGLDFGVDWGIRQGRSYDSCLEGLKERIAKSEGIDGQGQVDTERVAMVLYAFSWDDNRWAAEADAGASSCAETNRQIFDTKTVRPDLSRMP